MKIWSVRLFALFFVLAGSYHFISPESYLPLMPDYFPAKSLLNSLSGLAEIVLGIGLLFRKTQKWAALGIFALLIAFIPVHVYFIQEGACLGELCVPLWVGWVRLLVIHPLLLWWAWSSRK